MTVDQLIQLLRKEHPGADVRTEYLHEDHDQYEDSPVYSVYGDKYGVWISSKDPNYIEKE
jgi:hypothetical protein